MQRGNASQPGARRHGAALGDRDRAYADGRLLASGGADCTLRRWDTRSGVCQAILHDHSSGIIGASLSADGRLAASVTNDGVVRVWDARRGHCLARVRASVPALFEVAANADATWVVSGGDDGNVHVWDNAVRAANAS